MRDAFGYARMTARRPSDPKVLYVRLKPDLAEWVDRVAHAAYFGDRQELAKDAIRRLISEWRKEHPGEPATAESRRALLGKG